MDPEIKDEGGLDIEAGVAEIAAGMGFESDEPIDDPETDPVDLPADTAPPDPVDPPVVAARPAPKSWSKEKHEVWSKLPPEAQEQVELREKQMLDGLEAYKADSGMGKQMREIVTPYRALLASQGVDEGKAVSVLLNAHYKLSTLPPAERNNYFAALAQTYGVDLAQAQVPQQQVDPAVRDALARINKLEGALTQRESQALQQHREKVSADVNTFANDPAHAYFDEVADDIIVFINAGYELPEAYARAVRANPVTHAKESARLQTEADKKLRDKRTQEAKQAEKARSANVRSRDTRRAPTEPLGKMDDTMRETLAEINARAH